MVERAGGKVYGKMWPDNENLALNRREATVARTAVNELLKHEEKARCLLPSAVGELCALEIRLHNFLSSTEKN